VVVDVVVLLLFIVALLRLLYLACCFVSADDAVPWYVAVALVCCRVSTVCVPVAFALLLSYWFVVVFAVPVTVPLLLLFALVYGHICSAALALVCCLAVSCRELLFH
jgi:hypothetical protein